MNPGRRLRPTSSHLFRGLRPGPPAPWSGFDFLRFAAEIVADGAARHCIRHHPSGGRCASRRWRVSGSSSNGRTPAWHVGDWGSNPHDSTIHLSNGPIVQRPGRHPVKVEMPGSIPAGAAMSWRADWVGGRLQIGCRMGSIPTSMSTTSRGLQALWRCSRLLIEGARSDSSAAHQDLFSGAITGAADKPVLTLPDRPFHLGCKHRRRCTRLLTGRSRFESVASHHFFSHSPLIREHHEAHPP
jgi:hypothetical protein